MLKELQIVWFYEGSDRCGAFKREQDWNSRGNESYNGGSDKWIVFKCRKDDESDVPVVDESKSTNHCDPIMIEIENNDKVANSAVDRFTSTYMTHCKRS